MLTELHIENIAVIEKADIEFQKGLTVLTGETGAGKSIIVDSLGAVLGARTSRELIRTGADKGVVSAVFETDAADKWFEDNDIERDGEIIIQRRIGADGRSSCRVCGVPVSVAQLRELGAYLLDIHGQNDGRQLMDEERHLSYLDAFAEDDAERTEFAKNYGEYLACKKEIKRLSMDELSKQRLADDLNYRIEELQNAGLRIGEEDELSARRDLLRNSEKLTEALDAAYSLLYDADENAVGMVDSAASLIVKASAVSEDFTETAENLKNASSLLYDAAERIRDFRYTLDFSPEEYDALETRLSLLRKLRRKYNMDEAELLKHLDDCRQKLSELEYADDMLIKLQKKLQGITQSCWSAAKVLRAKRSVAARSREARSSAELRDLSMPSVRFSVEISPIGSEVGFDSSGADTVRFLISANAGEALAPISKIASGGELSRIMLALKTVFSANDPVDAMVFDEIDTGVSGIAAQRVGEKLSDISRGKQVLCITHLPQNAAIADNHEPIVKTERRGRTYTEVHPLDRAGRCRELARMHGGDNITELTLASAEEQLSAADKYKLTKSV